MGDSIHQLEKFKFYILWDGEFESELDDTLIGEIIKWVIQLVTDGDSDSNYVLGKVLRKGRNNKNLVNGLLQNENNGIPIKVKVKALQQFVNNNEEDRVTLNEILETHKYLLYTYIDGDNSYNLYSYIVINQFEDLAEKYFDEVPCENMSKRILYNSMFNYSFFTHMVEKIKEKCKENFWDFINYPFKKENENDGIIKGTYTDDESCMSRACNEGLQYLNILLKNEGNPNFMVKYNEYSTPISFITSLIDGFLENRLRSNIYSIKNLINNEHNMADLGYINNKYLRTPLSTIGEFKNDNPTNEDEEVKKLIKYINDNASEIKYTLVGDIDIIGKLKTIDLIDYFSPDYCNDVLYYTDYFGEFLGKKGVKPTAKTLYYNEGELTVSKKNLLTTVVENQQKENVTNITKAVELFENVDPTQFITSLENILKNYCGRRCTEFLSKNLKTLFENPVVQNKFTAEQWASILTESLEAGVEPSVIDVIINNIEKKEKEDVEKKVLNSQFIIACKNLSYYKVKGEQGFNQEYYTQVLNTLTKIYNRIDNINAVDKNGNTPIMEALKSVNIPALDLILTKNTKYDDIIPYTTNKESEKSEKLEEYKNLINSYQPNLLLTNNEGYDASNIYSKNDYKYNDWKKYYISLLNYLYEGQKVALYMGLWKRYNKQKLAPEYIKVAQLLASEDTYDQGKTLLTELNKLLCKSDSDMGPICKNIQNMLGGKPPQPSGFGKRRRKRRTKKRSKRRSKKLPKRRSKKRRSKRRSKKLPKRRSKRRSRKRRSKRG